MWKQFGNLVQSKHMCYSNLSTRNSIDYKKNTWIKGTGISYIQVYMGVSSLKKRAFNTPSTIALEII